VAVKSPAPGGPGLPPRWTRGAKDAVGTAYSTASRVWYTLAAGILTEVYYPTIDTPQIRDLQFLVTDGATFFHDDPAQCAPSASPASSCRFTNTLLSNFDGLGHYRQTDVTSNFPSAHAKKAFTHYVGTLSTYGLDAQQHRLPYSMFPEDAPWLPNRYDEQWSEENGTATRSFFKFDADDGSLTFTQVPKGTAAAHDDLVAGTSGDLGAALDEIGAELARVESDVRGL